MRTSFISRPAHGSRPGWTHRIQRLRGSTVVFDLRRYEPALFEIGDLGGACRVLSEQDITQRGRTLQRRARAGEPLVRLRNPLFALVREAARRVLGLRPFDEQIVAALALDDGHVVEMQTGEGKTLAAVLPAVLNALTGRGVHVLTFNDYLARRDAEWMGPVYRLLGLSVAAIQQGMSPGVRREGYATDVTYVTAKEAGFDHLRDRLAMCRGDLVHRSFHFAIVDEADSLFIDEASVPLVIAGRVEGHEGPASRVVEIASALTPGVHFDTDEYGRSVELTEDGIDRVERLAGCGTLHDAENLTLLTQVNCALHARVLLRRDIDYIVREGRIEMVDGHTGRAVRDRHWPDGLQAALEAKEGLRGRGEGRILGSMTLQRFLRGYSRVCGMTGTAREAAGELQQAYGLDVVVIPPHRPVVRVDHDDLVFTDLDAKERAVVGEVRRAHATGRPVLVGTASVIESERLAGQLRGAGVPCEVLNARHDAEEAAIVARAGAPGAVTISTNMAGRGTDIRLGGDRETARDCVTAVGGLYVIGTNRHESRRVDLQLRGRAGRQGDPGESRFFVSVEDDLLVRYGIRGLIPPRAIPGHADAPLDNPIVRREVSRTQRIVDGQHLEIRHTLARYADVVERQHDQLAARRQALLLGEADPGVWERAPARRDPLVAAVGERAVLDVERQMMLACIDAGWSDHLAFCAELREGIHLVRLGGADPLTRFTQEAIAAFSRLDETIDSALLDALAAVQVVDGRLDLSRTGRRVPSSTWTYLVNDDPFRNRLGAFLTGPGGATLAIYSAAVLMPLLILWGLAERLMRRSGARRSSPFGR